MTDRVDAPDAGDRPSGRQAFLRFVFGFLCVFGALALPSPGLGPSYVRLHTAVANALIDERIFASGARLRFEASPRDLLVKPWQTMLVIARSERAPAARVAVDLRTLGYLPTVVFVALVAATPVRSVRRSLGVIFLGLAILVPLLLFLNALPLVSFLGGQGPVNVFSLSPAGHIVVNTVYRALVAPLGMAYAVPLLLFWALLQIRVSAFGTGPLFTKFHRKRPHDVTSVPAQPG